MDTITAKDTSSKKELPSYTFNRADNSWVFNYIDNDVKKPIPVKFQLSKNLWGMTPALLEKEYHWAIDAALFMKGENGEWEKDPYNKIPIPIPNLFIHDDPHQILNEKQMNELYHALIREAQYAWIRRIADLWIGDVCRKSDALDFTVKVVNEPTTNKE